MFWLHITVCVLQFIRAKKTHHTNNNTEGQQKCNWGIVNSALLLEALVSDTYLDKVRGKASTINEQQSYTVSKLF